MIFDYYDAAVPLNVARCISNKNQRDMKISLKISML